MKVKFLKSTMAGGRVFNAGEEHDVNRALAATVIKQEQAEIIDASSLTPTPQTNANRKAALSQLNAKSDAELRAIAEGPTKEPLPADASREAMIQLIMERWDRETESNP